MTQHSAGGQGASYIEPSLGVAFLPRCPNCLGRHPLAYNPPLPAGICPECDTLLVEAPPAVHVPAVLTGRDVRMAIGRACLAAGKYFALLWRSRQ